MLVLGIHSGHDSSAAVVKDGKIVLDVAEERFTRLKHCSNLPIKSIQFCLDYLRLTNINDFDKIVVANNNIISDLRIMLNLENDKNIGFKKSLLKLGQNFLGVAKKKLPIYYPDFSIKDKDKISNVEHHLAHAASAYYTQPHNKDCLVFTVDGIGDGKSVAIWEVKNGHFNLLKSWGGEASIGWAYSIVTEGLYWQHGDGEGKTMGLAPYGNFNECRGVLDDLFPKFENGELVKEVGFGEGYFWNESGSFQWHFDEASEVEALIQKYGRENIAAEAQRLLEENILDLVYSWLNKTKHRHAAFAGGVFLNVKLNQRIWQKRGDMLETQHIFPNSGDSGIAVGAALYEYYRNKSFQGNALEHLYFGTEYPDDKIEKILTHRKLNFHKMDNAPKEVAKLLADGNIIGWFQGRMESGPRALGNRSILMSPLKAENKDIINARVKYREGFRPFCPSLLYEKKDDYLVDSRDEFFMITSFDVREEKKDKIPAVVHVDGTVRPQFVKKEHNSKYWALINEFGSITGEYVLLNTSFNIKGEPIINTPQEAIRCFFDGGIDYLILGDFLVSK